MYSVIFGEKFIFLKIYIYPCADRAGWHLQDHPGDGRGYGDGNQAQVLCHGAGGERDEPAEDRFLFVASEFGNHYLYQIAHLGDDDDEPEFREDVNKWLIRITTPALPPGPFQYKVTS